MLFVRLGQIAAWLLLVSGGMTFASGLGFAILGDQELFRQYFPGKSTGENIDKGLYWMGLGIAFGTAAHVASALNRIARSRA